MPMSKRKEKGLQISNFAFYWLFSSDIMAVKGLMSRLNPLGSPQDRSNSATNVTLSVS